MDHPRPGPGGALPKKGNWRGRGSRAASSFADGPQVHTSNVRRPVQQTRSGGGKPIGNLNTVQASFSGGKREYQKRSYNLSYTRLLGLANETNNNNVVLMLSNSDYNFDTLVQESVRPDMFFLLIKVLARVCLSDFTDNQTKVLIAACKSSKFINQLAVQLMSLDDRSNDEFKDLAHNLILFFETVSQKLAYALADAVPAMKSAYATILMQNQTKSLDLDKDGSLARLEEVINEVKMKTEEEALPKKSRSEMWKERKIKEHEFAAPDNFREIQIYPKPDEILTEEKPFLRVNLIDRAYTDVEHYLDTQFRLTREDFVRPLREGIAAINSHDTKKIKEANVRICNHIQFVRDSSQLIPKELNAKRKNDRDEEGVLVYLNLEKNKGFKKMDWQHCRRFMYGSLLCFTKDNYKTIMLSTVSNRGLDYLNAGFLRVKFCEPPEGNIYIGSFTMIESEVFFDPYYHVLKTLQSINSNSFPLESYIVKFQKEVYNPRYLEVEPPVQYNLLGYRYPVTVLDIKTWPDYKDLELDPTQYRALCMALTQELAVIQGPPGTGKTFIGLKIAETLVTNRKATNRTTPILVVCLTNHALDQFLVGISKFTSKVVRIGGQSKNEDVANFNLKLLRRHSKLHSQRYANSKQEIAANKKQMNDIDTSLKELRKGIISYEYLRDVGIAPEHMFPNDSQFLMWLVPQNWSSTLCRVGTVNFAATLSELEFEFASLNELKIKEKDGRELNKLSSKTREIDRILTQVRQKLELGNCIAFNKKQVSDILKSSQNVLGIGIHQRWQLYMYWLETLTDVLLQNVAQFENDLIILEKQQEELQEVEDLEILRENEVVGMTTSGAARLQGLLRKLGTEIVIVEEAAEVMEPHVIACLTERCQHLILIGDHKQLRPNIAVYQLAKDYNFDISLFERMVKRDPDSCVTLEVQHRMAPEIAALIVPAVYEKLLNAYNVKQYARVKGICKRLYFIDHQNFEERTDIDSHSKINKFEAEYAMALAKHLLMQGYSSSEITILATYRGQMFHIRKEKKKYPTLDNVLVTVVDNYQGEENKIIILSLVRSNAESSIGFLKMVNRVNVALSRAMYGLYIIGNMDCLTGPNNGDLWKSINKTLASQNAIGHSLPLICEKHPEMKCRVSSAQDFAMSSPQGGCTLNCQVPLIGCGHRCQSVCHTQHQDHKDMKCTSPCEQMCDSLRHRCKKKCYEFCGECNELVTERLPCKHEATYPCHIGLGGYKCMVKVEKLFPLCKHKVVVSCYLNPASSPCPAKCDQRLDCGHKCEYSCHIRVDPDHLKYSCSKTCNKVNIGCSTGDHRCGKLCYEECQPCNVVVIKKRKCGHDVKVACLADPDLEGVCNMQKCTRLLNCSHTCNKPCMEECYPCEQEVHTLHPKCGHPIVKKCGVPFSEVICKEKCSKRMSCGHLCQDVCGRKCDEANCAYPVVKVQAECGHNVDLFCWEYKAGLRQPSDLLRCKSPCLATLECEHPCTGSCGTCYRGRFHTLCDQPCGRNLICNHLCKEMCANACPPCLEQCSFSCEHSKCPKKCGEPCVPCKERCTIGCDHRQCKRMCGEICDVGPCNEPCKKLLDQCEHPCVGVCGEPCPPLCRICDEEELTDILFGTEDEPDARFVYLPDCNHCIEVTAMDTHMEGNTENGTIKVNVCPKCRTGVTAKRYSSIIKRNLLMVNQVKIEYFGKPMKNEEHRDKLLGQISKLLRDNEDLNETFPELFFCLSDLLDSIQKTVNQRKNVMHMFSLRAREIEFQILSEICKIWRMCQTTSERNGVQEQSNFLLQVFESKKRRVSQQQIEDFKPELMRLQYIRILLSFMEKGKAFPQVEVIIKEGLAVDRSRKFTDNSERNIKELVAKLKQICKNVPGLGITETERVEILQAMTGQLKHGSWYQCPKGHVYVIGECGGAMQTSKCPECGATIGGGNHRLTEGNRHFSGMDRSAQAAWPPH
ncbi:NFX1-type zinc finger-containing protein 1-like isoform X1 [Cloeon dipterum]|uniref:NFX1-type zinc finger-containing protein 1-like isoform X1 n=1 Tax=Cloeon dipterum TaxID=197152 RepID=UPI00321FC360